MGKSKATIFVKLLLMVALCIFLFFLSSCLEKVDFDELRSLDGVVMTAEKSTYASDVEKIKVTWTNSTSRSLTFGDSYYLVKKMNNKWKKVSVPNNTAFNDIGYIILPYSEAQHTYQLHYIYTDLDAGTYRIVTHFFDDADIPVTSDDEYYLFAEFTLTDDADDLETVYVEFDELRSQDGVTMIPERTTYAVDMVEISVTWENNTSNRIFFGNSFYFVIKENDKWKKLEPYEIYFDQSGSLILPNGEADHTYRFDYIYGDLEVGTYRIVKDYYYLSDIPVTLDAYYVFAEFTLTDDAGFLKESAGHFFRTEFGGALVNFPSDAYPPDPSKEEYDSAILIIETAEEMQEMFSQTYSQAWSDEAQSWVRDETFSDLIDQYDEAFFESNQLVTFAVSASGGAYYFTFSKATYADGTLTIEITQQSYGIGHCAIVAWFAMIEVERVPADTQIEIVVKSRGW